MLYALKNFHQEKNWQISNKRIILYIRKFLLCLNLGIISLITLVVIFWAAALTLSEPGQHFLTSPVSFNTFLLLFGGIFIIIKQLNNFEKFPKYFLLYYVGIGTIPATWLMTLDGSYIDF